MDDSLDFSQMSKTKETVEEEMHRELSRTQGRESAWGSKALKRLSFSSQAGAVIEQSETFTFVLATKFLEQKDSIDFPMGDMDL